MTHALDTIISRRDFLNTSVSAAALAALPGAAVAAACGKAAVLAQIPKMHAANIKRLQDWIALPSIAAEKRSFGREGRDPGQGTCSRLPRSSCRRGTSAWVTAPTRTRRTSTTSSSRPTRGYRASTER